MRVLAADPATEMVDLDAGSADEPAVEQSLIDKLAGAAVAGDGAARDRLIAEVHPLVLGYCRRRLSRREAVLASADDVAQEICIAVVAALQSYVVSGRSFRSFVFGIAANKVADAFRAMSRNRTELMADLPDGRCCTMAPSNACSTKSSPSGWPGCCSGSRRGSAQCWSCGSSWGSAPRRPQRSCAPARAPSGSPSTAPSTGSALPFPTPAP